MTKRITISKGEDGYLWYTECDYNPDGNVKVEIMDWEFAYLEKADTKDKVDKILYDKLMARWRLRNIEQRSREPLWTGTDTTDINA